MLHTIHWFRSTWVTIGRVKIMVLEQSNDGWSNPDNHKFFSSLALSSLVCPTFWHCAHSFPCPRARQVDSKLFKHWIALGYNLMGGKMGKTSWCCYPLYCISNIHLGHCRTQTIVWKRSSRHTRYIIYCALPYFYHPPSCLSFSIWQ